MGKLDKLSGISQERYGIAILLPHKPKPVISWSSLFEKIR